MLHLVCLCLVWWLMVVCRPTGFMMCCHRCELVWGLSRFILYIFCLYFICFHYQMKCDDLRCRTCYFLELLQLHSKVIACKNVMLTNHIWPTRSVSEGAAQKCWELLFKECPPPQKAQTVFTVQFV